MVVLFTAWGYEVTALEFAAVLIALAAIGLGIRGSRWTWPLYLTASALYGALFVQYDLLASAALQLVFIGAAVWGWFTWGAQGVVEPRLVPSGQRYLIAVGVVLGTVVLAPALQAIGGAATWLDSFILLGSLAAQVLMVLEYVEAWPAWLIVDLVAVAHYAHQGLWFTSLFYGVLVGMAGAGLRAWSARRAEEPRAAAVT